MNYEFTDRDSDRTFDPHLIRVESVLLQHKKRRHVGVQETSSKKRKE